MSEEKTSLKTEVVEEQAPEAPSAATAAPTLVTETEKKSSRKSSKASVKETPAEATPAEQPKKKGFSFPKPNFQPKYYEGVEYKNRDPTNLHPDIKVNFADVIAEPDGAHSFETIWGTSYKSYSLVKFWTYQIVTAVLAVPISILWGLYFALLAFCSIWCIVPCIKGFIIWMNFIKKVWGLMVRTFLDPLFESIGLIFTKINIALNIEREGIKNAE